MTTQTQPTADPAARDAETFTKKPWDRLGEFIIRLERTGLNHKTLNQIEDVIDTLEFNQGITPELTPSHTATEKLPQPTDREIEMLRYDENAWRILGDLIGTGQIEMPDLTNLNSCLHLNVAHCVIAEALHRINN